MLPREALYYKDKGSAPFIGYSIDVVGLFPQNEDSNCYLLVTMDPLSKWVENYAATSLHSWRVAEYLYNDVVAHWGKPHYVWMDNGTEFMGSFV